MKELYRIFTTIILSGLILSCQEKEIFQEIQTDNSIGVYGDMIKVRLNAIAPDPFVVNTKAVDPDGKGVQTMTLFCFNEQGLFISTATAQIDPNPENSEAGGIFDAFIPNTTRVMHLVGNQNMTPFKEDDFRQKSEDEVMSVLEGSAGMIIYWARVEVPENVMELYKEGSSTGRSKADAILDWITIETNPDSETHNSTKGKNYPILMLRNQARVTVKSDGAPTDGDQWSGTYFKVTGFTVCNTQAFGTVAPYHSSNGFPTYECTTFDPTYGIAEWRNVSEVTLPANKEKFSDIMDVSTSKEVFVFETENSSADPVDIIIKGRNIIDGDEQMELYYKVNITDIDGGQIPVRRNHHYQVNIAGNLNYGSATFGEALSAPATNNIWLSISDEVKTVMNSEYQLTVDETSVVVNNNSITPTNKNLVLKFNVKAIGNGVTIQSNNLSVQWIDNEQQISNTHNPNLVIGGAVSFNETSGEGTITLALNNFSGDNETQEGTLLVKYGHLQRKIKVVIVNTQEFVPAWVSTEVYGTVTGDQESRENVTLMFTIPETCPDELLPLDVLISVNGLDIRSASGMVLPIVRKGEQGYGEDNGIGYKYKYTIAQKGIQRVYFENILSVGDGATETIKLEAENFEPLTKIMTFSDEDKYISVESMLDYDFSSSGSTTVSEKIYYILVPQKRYAPVTFSLKTLSGNNNAVGITTSDEFLLYSSNLDHYEDNDSRIQVIKDNFDCTFKPYTQDKWGTGGRIFGFYPRQNIPDGTFEIYMETNKAKSAEVVRIASNQPGREAVATEGAIYSGQTFRSVTFEMANYRPFRFAAQINNAGEYENDNNLESDQTPKEEVDSNIEFSYVPNQPISISFDITSFKAQDNKSINPFGTGFEIFIDAPSLILYPEDNPNIETQTVTMFEKNADGSIPSAPFAQKPKLEDLGNGKFVYRVDPNRIVEAGFWNNSVTKIEDGTTDVSQSGERKTIMFRTKDIVSSGDITISSNEEQVVYHSKTFKVHNTPISGTIKYKDGTEEKNIPQGQFVSFSRDYNGSRIGSMTVKENGNYELRLRKEYEFYWIIDPMTIMVSIGGKYYSAQIPDLNTLYKNRNIILNLVKE